MRSRVLALCLATVAIVAEGGGQVASAAPTELFFSEYIEGSSNNKALEIYNGTGAPINLGSFDAFVYQVDAQRGKALTSAQADLLIRLVGRL